MIKTAMPETSLSFINIGFAHPVLDALDKLSVPPSDQAQQLAVPQNQLRNTSVRLPANTIYEFLAWASDRAGNPHFCAEIGCNMARGGWKPIHPLLNASNTVGDFLFKFSELAERQGNAASYKLEVEAGYATWQLRRPKEASVNCKYADAIAVGFFCELFKLAAKERWNPDELVVVTSDRNLIPPAFLPSKTLLPGGIGVSIRFPSALLSLSLPPLQAASVSDAIPKVDTEPDLSEHVRTLIESNLVQEGFGIAEVAGNLGLKRWHLQACLRNEGTSFAELRNKVRKELAVQWLSDPNASVSAVARDLGYKDRSNFTRAFRAWTGSSPQAFRKNL